MTELTKKQKFLKALFYVMPHHAVSRVVYFITRLRGPQVVPMIEWFVKKYGVDMDEAAESEIAYYQTFNEFFTRPLKDNIRPIAPGDNTLACPCDGTVSQAGPVRAGAILQAKGRGYSVLELLGGDKTMAAQFADGRFATIYLAPRDYHRLHMPLAANIIRMIHVPGRLFSVAEWTVEEIPRLFARNERLACYFETDAGPMVMVLVGAINVSAIETVWSGLVVPPGGKKISEYDYSHTRKEIAKGAEMGRFNMGSTVILLTGNNVEWLPHIAAGQPVKMGQLIGHFPK
ncbi:MAG: phosphatidylserine decarboxylase [Gammaproteobacteria bacterium]|jgi:phosphatidylserine decarboxylase|nr:phosphatidylserine decarboxylase [Gammaproteobacteria bacterium]